MGFVDFFKKQVFVLVGIIGIFFTIMHSMMEGSQLFRDFFNFVLPLGIAEYINSNYWWLSSLFLSISILRFVKFKNWKLGLIVVSTLFVFFLLLKFLFKV